MTSHVPTKNQQSLKLHVFSPTADESSIAAHIINCNARACIVVCCQGFKLCPEDAFSDFRDLKGAEKIIGAYELVKLDSNCKPPGMLYPNDDWKFETVSKNKFMNSLK